MAIKKINNQLSFIVYRLSFIVIIGCAKEQTTKIETTSNSTSQTTIASDVTTLNDEFDQAADDAIAVMCNPKMIIKGALIDTSRISSGIIEIDYYGKEADGTKTRTGADSIHLGMSGGSPVKWSTPGATASITMGTINSPGYEVQFLSNNTSIRINGTASLTNLYGGYFQNLTAGDSLIALLKGSLTYTSNDNAATVVYYPWNFNVLRSFTKTDTIVYATTRADTTINGFNNVAEWGTDRFGNNYLSTIPVAVVQNISNPLLSYNPLSGVRNIENITEPINCTYGVNQQGSVITSGTPYGFYISWINNGGGAQDIIPYYY